MLHRLPLRSIVLQEHYMKEVTNCWIFFSSDCTIGTWTKDVGTKTIVIHAFNHFQCPLYPVQACGGSVPGALRGKNALWM